jgi:hypothetical protein
MSSWEVHPQIQEFEEFPWTHEEKTQSLYKENKLREAKNKSSRSDSKSQENEFEDHGRCRETATKHS